MHFTNFVFEMLVDRINVNNLVKGDKITKEQTIVKSAESYFERHATGRFLNFNARTADL